MKIKSIGSNQTVLFIKKGKKNYSVLFSYATPVAYLDESGQFYATNVKYSRTTSRHINSWISGNGSIEIPQTDIDSIVE